MKRNVTTYLSREEIRELVTASDAQGALSVLTTWAIIAATFVVLAAFPTNPIVWLLAIVILGGRQLALAILMHECAHQSLFATRALNDVLGKPERRARLEPTTCLELRHRPSRHPLRRTPAHLTTQITRSF